MGPHEYYDNWHGYDHDDHMPHLHNRGAAHTYLEPDWFANHMDSQLPAISTIGRGPRGESVTAEPIYDKYNDDGTPAEGARVIGFRILDDDGNVLVDTGNSLEPPTIDITYPDIEGIDPGQPFPVTVTVTQQGKSKSYTFYVPAGVRGSLIFLLKENLDYRGDKTYVTTVGDLTIYGKQEYRNKPNPRPDDTVIFTHKDENGNGQLLALGTVESVGKFTRADMEGVLLPYKDADGNDIWMVPYNDNEIEPTDKVVFTSRVDLDLTGPQGPKGDSLHFDDLTEDQIEQLKTEVQTAYMKKTEAVVGVEFETLSYLTIPLRDFDNHSTMLFVDVNGLDVSPGVHYDIIENPSMVVDPDDHYDWALQFYDDSHHQIYVPAGEIHMVCIKSVAVTPEDFDYFKGDPGDITEATKAEVWESFITMDIQEKDVNVLLVDEMPAVPYAPAFDEIISIYSVQAHFTGPCALGGWHLEPVDPSDPNGDVKVIVRVIDTGFGGGVIHDGSIQLCFTYQNLGHGHDVE